MLLRTMSFGKQGCLVDAKHPVNVLSDRPCLGLLLPGCVTSKGVRFSWALPMLSVRSWV